MASAAKNLPPVPSPKPFFQMTGTRTLHLLNPQPNESNAAKLGGQLLGANA